VGVKLLIEDVVKIGPVASLGIIAVSFTVGIIASLIADKNDPDSERKREERKSRTLQEPESESENGSETEREPAASD
jgi:hypothetical protein